MSTTGLDIASIVAESSSSFPFSPAWLDTQISSTVSRVLETVGVSERRRLVSDI